MVAWRNVVHGEIALKEESMGSPLFHQNPRFVSFISVCSLAQQRFDERVHKVKLISAKDSQKKLLKLLLMSKILV